MTTENEARCQRPYTLGKRAEQSDQTRAAVLNAARRQLETGGFLNLTMDALARESGVTRQTVHNLFKTKTGVLEALLDQLALDGGMAQMANLMRQGMQQTDAGALLDGFVGIFTGFWSKDRKLTRRIQGLGAVDPEFGAAIDARNERRKMAAARIVDRLEEIRGNRGSPDKRRQIALLFGLTSFEFFDSLAENLGSTREAADAVVELVRVALNSGL